MTQIVDASVVIALTQEGAEALSERFWGNELHAPELLLPEVANSLRRQMQRHEIGASAADGWFTWLRTFDAISLHGHRDLAKRIWELRHNFTPYDASYVALAEQLGGTLHTLDRRLARAAEALGTCGVVIPEA